MKPETGLLYRNLIKLLQYPPITENQMEKNMENEMETGVMCRLLVASVMHSVMQTAQDSDGSR